MHAFLLFNDLFQIQLNCIWPIKMQISEDNFSDSRSRRAVGFRRLDCLTREFKLNSPTPHYYFNPEILQLFLYYSNLEKLKKSENTHMRTKYPVGKLSKSEKIQKVWDEI